MYKKLKMLLLTVIVLLFSSFTLGCGNMFNRYIEDDDKKAEETLQRVLDAIENKDKDTLKTVFSKKSLNETADMDSNIDNIFDFFQGQAGLLDEGTLGTDESFEYGLKLKRYVYRAVVIINQERYFFFLLEYPVDKEEPDNVGLYTLFITKEENREYFGYWQDHVYPGIVLWEPSEEDKKKQE